MGWSSAFSSSSTASSKPMSSSSSSPGPAPLVSLWIPELVLPRGVSSAVLSAVRGRTTVLGGQ